jgi:hypothetical protein
MQFFILDPAVARHQRRGDLSRRGSYVDWTRWTSPGSPLHAQVEWHMADRTRGGFSVIRIMKQPQSRGNAQGERPR